MNMNMEDLVNKLAELQAERKAQEDAANSDRIICKFELEIKEMESALATLIQARDECKSQYIEQVAKIDIKADALKAQIIDAWDGEKRTVRYGAGLLKIRTTTSLKIHDGQILLDNLIHHFPTYVIVEKYISGFNKTQVRKFIDLHPQSHSVVELVPKTTVKLEVK